MVKHRLRAFLLATLATVLIFGGGLASSAGALARAGTAGQIKHGGSITVLVPSGSWPQLDTATDPEQAADSTILNDIDGELFEAGPNGSIIYDLATSAKFSDHNLLVTINLRHGVTFQDGTPFDAQAVAFNINRDLQPANACLCLTLFSDVASVTASGTYQVLVHLSAPFAPLLAAFINNAPDEPESMTAVQTESATAFGQHPIGAGPFELVSMTPSTTVVLQRNPNYWEKGHPYLNGITFESTSSDQSDYEAIQTGQAQATTLTTIPLVEQIKQSKSLNLTVTPTTLYYYVAFNTTKAPFNNPLVREALSYATDPKQIIKSVFDGIYPPTEALCSSQTNYCPTKKVSTYLGYNPTKAKKLIAEVESQTGQPFPTIQLYGFLPTNATLTEAIAQEWEAVGVSVNITIVSVIPTYVVDYRNGTWTAWVQNAVLDSTDPATGTFAMYGVNGLFTGADDPTLQSMLVRAESLVSPAARAPLYQQIFQYLDKNAYGVPIYQGTTITVTAKNVENYVIAGGVSVDDENVWLK